MQYNGQKKKGQTMIHVQNAKEETKDLTTQTPQRTGRWGWMSLGALKG